MRCCPEPHGCIILCIYIDSEPVVMYICSMAMKRLQMYFDTEQYARLQELSDQSGLSVAALVRRSVDAFLSYAEGQSWDQFLKPTYALGTTKRKR